MTWRKEKEKLSVTDSHGTSSMKMYTRDIQVKRRKNYTMCYIVIYSICVIYIYYIQTLWPQTCQDYKCTKSTAQNKAQLNPCFIRNTALSDLRIK